MVYGRFLLFSNSHGFNAVTCLRILFQTVRGSDFHLSVILASIGACPSLACHRQIHRR